MAGPDVEPKPLVHVAAAAGWLNDPVGGLVHAGRYHLFFQYVPAATRWQPGCHWGHLVGDDLVRWRQLPVALQPGDGDDGVWSGSAVVDRSGPVLVYTGVVDGDLDRGRIALARPLDEGLVRWHKDPAGPVLPPPADPDLLAFRDPYVWGEPGRWRMVVGAGLRDRGGAALLFGGADLRSWSYRGVLADSGAAELGAVWECPQYVDLDGTPTLIVSIVDEGRPDRVVAARGREVAGRFDAGPWHTLGHGGSAYALTTYRDRSGRLAGTAWLRDPEPAAARAEWSGMLSLPVLLTGQGPGGVAVAPHPDVDTLRGTALDARGGRVDLDGDATADLDVELGAGGRLWLDGGDTAVVLVAEDGRLAVDAGGRQLTVAGARPGPPVRLRVVVDRGVVEAWTGDGQWIALRVPYLRVRAVAVGGPARLAAWRLKIE